jgi:predicted aldo/keto reductase-like oxidoreductase
MILTENPGIEFVQLQFNYLDYEDKWTRAKECYEVCVKHGKYVLVMEPVRGGRLANLPNDAKKILDDLNNGSNASYALRFCAGFENIKMILSGMSTIEQMEENVKVMKDVQPLNEKEMEAVQKVIEIFRNTKMIECTKCEYCMPVCPINMPIPEIFKRSNENNKLAYMKLDTLASECLRCGACENECPQHLPIRELLEKVVEKFE